MVEEVRGTAKPKWEIKVYIVLRLPLDNQEIPVVRMDRHEAECEFKVSLGHKRPGTQ